MAGFYNHITTSDGRLLTNESFSGTIENLGDAYEMAEELYGMIWFLAGGDRRLVDEAERNYKVGLTRSPLGGPGYELRAEFVPEEDEA